MTVKVSGVLIDETQYLSEDLKALVGKLEVAYIFDSEQVTYCCSTIPSYWLEPVWFQTENLLEEDDWNLLSRAMEDSQSAGMYVSYQLAAVPAGEFETLEDAVEYYRGNHGFNPDIKKV